MLQELCIVGDVHLLSLMVTSSIVSKVFHPRQCDKPTHITFDGNNIASGLSDGLLCHISKQIGSGGLLNGSDPYSFYSSLNALNLVMLLFSAI